MTESKDTSVSLSVIEFVDRQLANERRLTDSELARLRETHDTEREGDKEALKVASVDVDRRLEAHNRFREQIEKERGEYLTKELYDREHLSLANRVKELEISRGEQAGKAAAYAATFAFIAALLGIMAAIVGHYWK
jgi:hypothetical protein